MAYRLIALILLLVAPLAAQTTTIPVPSDATIVLRQNGAVVYTGPAAAGSSLTLSITPTPAPSGDISVKPLLLDFGAAQLGDLQQIKRVWVKNESSRTITVQTRDRQGAVEFRIDRYVNMPILPGMQAALDIAFRPVTVGHKVGTVRLVWLNGQADVQLKAEVLGAPPPPPPPPIPTPTPTPTPVPVPVPGEGWYVSPSGSATGDGTQANPWSLEVAVNGTHRSKTAFGGTVWLLPGTYRKSPNPEGLGFRCVVGGVSTNPLVFRAVPGSRVVIDGGFSFFAGSNYVWLWGVEIIVSEEKPHGTTGSWPPGAPTGGVNFYSSQSCKAINCVLRDNRQGASVWTEARDAEVYGCLVYDNGWVGTDRAHGHGLYIQNPGSTTKRAADNVFTARHSRNWRDGRYTMHGYGERVEVTNITAEGNLQAGVNDAWLLGAGASGLASTGHRMINNAIHGVRVRVGRSETQPLEFRGNTIAGQLELVGTGPLTNTGNLISPPDPRPAADTVVLRPNKYEPNRAHLLIVDWDRNGKGMLPLSGWVQAGERLRVLDVTDSWGQPVWQGTVPAGGVELAVTEARVFVLMKDAVPGVPTAPVREEAPVLERLR